MIQKLSFWLTAIRPKTLFITLGPIYIGLQLAKKSGFFDPIVAIITLLSALFIQIGTNLANDYYDGLKGSDQHRTNRMLASGKLSSRALKQAFLLCFLIASLLGLYLVYIGGIPILMIGITGIFLGWLYTASPYALAYKGLSEPFILAYFGPIAVAGTYYLQHLTFSLYACALGLGAGCLAIAILTLNNLRDHKEDVNTNKKTLVVQFGVVFGYSLYSLMWFIALLIPILIYYIATQNLLLLSLQALAIPAIFLIKQMKSSEPNYDTLLSKTGRYLLLYCLLLGIAC